MKHKNNNRMHKQGNRKRRNKGKKRTPPVRKNKPEKLHIKGWPPEVKMENPSYIGAMIVIAVVFGVGFFIWLRHL